MPRCCITKYFLESLKNTSQQKGIIHYYDEEIHGFLLEYRGNERGTWYFRYCMENNKTRYYRIGFLSDISIFDARARAYTLYNLVQKGVDIKKDIDVLHHIVSFDDFIEKHYVPHARIKKRSWELDVRILRLHILPQFGPCKMDRIKRIDVMAWQQSMRNKGLAPGTCNRAFVLLKSIFNCAIRWGHLSMDENPCCGVSAFEDRDLKERYLTTEEARRVVKALQESSQQSAQAILLLLYTGARRNEILSSRWEYVDLDRQLLTVPLSKSGKTRYIPLSDDAVRVFKNIPHKSESPWVFPGSGAKGHLQSVFRHWDSLRKRLGLHDVRLHDLRHSFASFLVNAGCSLYEVQRCLGHCDPKVTMRYAHLAPQTLVKAANTIGKSINIK